jgi:phenylacetate-CoA ligase
MTPFFDRPMETLPREHLRAHQWKRFLKLDGEVFPANPFVRRKWEAAGIRSAGDPKSWDDFFRLPFTTKAELAEDQAETPPFGTNLTYPLERYVRVHQTSGTTGTPIRWLDTQGSWEWWERCWEFVLRGAGVTAEDRVFFPFSFGFFVGFWAGFEGARRLGALVIPAGGQDSVTRLDTIAALGATVVVCTPSYALHLGQVARERGIELAQLPVRITVHAGEPGAGIPEVRRRIEAAWGAKAFDHSGMTEAGAYGFECVAQEGLHVNESEFIAEVIDPATLEPAREGELVLTNLGRAGSPVFRYRTGDRVRWDDSPCSCGRTFARLPGGILGRVDDMLIVRGVNVFPSALEGIVRRFEGVDEFLIEVFRRQEMDEVRLLLEIDGGRREGTTVNETVQGVMEAVRASLGIRVEAVPVPPQSLPRYELKARRLVRRVSGASGSSPNHTRR